MVLSCMRALHSFGKSFYILLPRPLPNQVTAKGRSIAPSSPHKIMARGNNNKARGKGYDWRQHTRPSNDPVIQNQVCQRIQQFLNDPGKPRALEFPPMEKSVVNTYRDYCREMGVGWARGSQKRHWKLIRLGGLDPEISLWKKVWCFYFRNYCDVDLLDQAQNAQDDETVGDGKKTDINMNSDTDLVNMDVDVPINAEDSQEAEAIAHLMEATENYGMDDLEPDGESQTSLDVAGEDLIVLDATAKSLDGKRMWTKVRDLLQEIKRNDQQLWEECRSLGVNNCSEKKLVQHLDKVQKFFDLNGNGPNQKIRGKKLKIGVSNNGEVHFLNAEMDKIGVIEYAKPIKYSDTSSIKRLIALVDKANKSLGVKSDNSIKCNLPSNIFNNNWRKKRRYFELGERLSRDNADPIYIERKKYLRKRLPAFNLGNEFCKHVFENDVVILCGATGCGKTTQLPQILMEEAAKLMHQQFSTPIDADNRCFGTGRIVCTQPRRISATSVTERVCFERNEKIGDRVGYQIRFEHRASDTTELLYCTTGILLRFLSSNPKLEGISAVIVDEIHERSVHSDFLLLILKDLVLERKATEEPLKIVLMSATIDASNLLQYFGADSGDNYGICDQNPMSVHFMEIPGNTNYPITEYFLEDIFDEIGPSFTLQGPPPESSCRRVDGFAERRNPWATANAIKEKYSEMGLPSNRYGNHIWENLSIALQKSLEIDLKLISAVVEHIERCEWSEKGAKRRKCGDEISANCHDETLGSILIFVPGWQEIKDVIKCLEKSLSIFRKQSEWAQNREWIILPLHSMIPPKDQNRIFDPPSPNCRKVIIATNIAETSITVEDVVYVIDPGLIKGTTYNPHTNIASLETGRIARSNRQQRRGRAGRCQPGIFFMLYSQYECLCEMHDHEIPEMLRIPVEELCLQVKSLRLPGNMPVKNILQKSIDPPKSMAVKNAVRLLIELGAFRDVAEEGISNEEMTPLGWKLSQLPVHPSLGKMLLLGSLFDQHLEENACSSVLPSLISICATLSFKSPFVLPFGKEKDANKAKKEYGKGVFSDHLVFAKVLDDYKDKLNYSCRGDLSQWLGKYYLSGKTLEMTNKIEGDLRRYLGDLGVDCNRSLKKKIENVMTMPPLLSAILAVSLNISFLPPMKRKILSLSGGSTCSVHPSSLISSIETMGDDKMIWRKFKHLLNEKNIDKNIQHFLLDQPDKVFVLGWFERLKTSDIYLRDCTLFRDPLPLLLLLPNVKQRGLNNLSGSATGSKIARDPTIFEVIGGKSSSGGNEDGKKLSNQPTLLLKAENKNTASSLMILRAKLDTFFGAVLSKTASSNAEDDVCNVFSGLESLFIQSHSLYCYISHDEQTSVQNSVFSDDILEIKHLCSFAECETLNPGLSDEEEINGGFDDARIQDHRPDFASGDWRRRVGGRGYGRKRGRGRGGRGRDRGLV